MNRHLRALAPYIGTVAAFFAILVGTASVSGCSRCEDFYDDCDAP